MSLSHQIVRASDGAISFGPRQVAFLHEHAYVSPIVPGLWESSLPVDELHALVWSHRDLRECDLCTTSPAPWQIECEPFQLHAEGPNRGAVIGGPKRPFLACDGCVRFIRSGERRRLIEYAIDSVMEHSREQGILRPGVSKKRARAAILETMTTTVNQMMDHATGRIDEA